LQPRPLQLGEICALPPQQRQQQKQGGTGSQQQQFTDRIGRDDEFPDGVAE